MLKALRSKKTMKTLLIALAILIIPAFVFWGVGSFSDGDAQIAGSIYGKKIGLKEYSDALEGVRNQAILIYGGQLAKLAPSLDLGRQAWERIILLKKAREAKIKVADGEIADFIQAHPFFWVNGSFNEKRYETIVQHSFQTSPRILEEQIRESLIIRRFLESTIGEITVGDDELLTEYKRNNEKIKISYISVPQTTAAAEEAEITDEAIAAYYQNNGDQFKLAPQANIQFIAFLYSDFAQSVAVTDLEAEEYYAANSFRYYTPAQIRAAHILLKNEEDIGEVQAKIAEGLPFEELAREYSIGPSKTNGGDLGYFSKGKMVPAFEEAAFALAVGEISAPVKTQFGYHLIKLTDKKEESTRPLEEVAEEIKTLLKDKKTKNAAYVAAEDLERAVNNDPVLFESAAGERGLKISETGYFEEAGFIPTIGWAQEVQKAAFAMNVGEVSPLIIPATKRSKGAYIIKLIDKKTERQKSLEEARADIVKILKADKLKELQASYAMELYQILQNKEKSFEDLSASENFTIVKTPFFTRNDYIPRLGPAQNLKEIFFDKNRGFIAPPIATPAGLIIAKYDEKKEIDLTKFKEEKNTYKARLTQVKAANATASLIDRFLKEANLKNNITINLN